MGDILPDEFANALHHYGAETLELEWRLGTFQGSQGFVAGLPQKEFEALQHALNASPVWTTVESQSMHERVDPHTQRKLVNNTHWMTKTRVLTVDYPPRVRVSLATEVVEPVTETLSEKAFGYQRFKERTSYRYRCWSVDLTKVVSTADRDSDVTTYEVEIELIDKDELFVRPIWNVIHWGHTLANDMLQLATSCSSPSSHSPQM